MSMSVKYAILGILSDQECHVYELSDAFNQRVGDFWNLAHGQIYSTLDRLEREGLVEWREQPQESWPGRKIYRMESWPGRRIYRITPKGRDQLRHWLAQPVGKARALRDELFIKLLFLDSANPELILTLISEQKRVYLSHLQQLARRKYELTQRPDCSSALVTKLLIDAALFHAEADIRWITMIEKALPAASARRSVSKNLTPHRSNISRRSGDRYESNSFVGNRR